MLEVEVVVKRKSRIFLIDDHPMVREGLKTLLEMSNCIVCGEAGSGEEALQKLKSVDLDIALIDIRLPDMNGIDLAMKVREINPGIKVAILTSFSDESMVLRAARAGVNGYMLKEIAPEKLYAAIGKMMDGAIVMDDRANEILLRGLANEAEEGESRQRWGMLSAQELRVAELVACGLINKEIADQMNLSDKTVKNYMASIFTKLNISRRAQVASFYTKFKQAG